MSSSSVTPSGQLSHVTHLMQEVAENIMVAAKRKVKVLNLLMTKMPDELIEFDNNKIKNELERALDPFQYTWGGHNVN